MYRIAVAIVERSRRFLLAKRRHPETGLSWRFPQTRVKPGEQDVVAAERAVKEETGVTARGLGAFGEREDATGHTVSYWLCEYVSGEAHVDKPKDDLEVRWVSGMEAMDLFTSIVYPPVADYLRRSRI